MDSPGMSLLADNVCAVPCTCYPLAGSCNYHDTIHVQDNHTYEELFAILFNYQVHVISHPDSPV